MKKDLFLLFALVLLAPIWIQRVSAQEAAAAIGDPGNGCPMGVDPAAPPSLGPVSHLQQNFTSTTQANQSYLDFRYAGLGDTHFLKPAFQEIPLSGANPNSVFHTYDTHDLRGGFQSNLPGSSTEAPGNIFSAVNVNAAYRDDMWRTDNDQAADFARRTIHMLGAQFFAMSDLVSGVGKTRASQNDRLDLGLGGKDKKYTIGSLSYAMGLRGTSSRDEFAAIGASNHASSHFVNPPDDDEETAISGLNALQAKRFHYGLLQGTESGAWVGRAISPRLSATDNPVDPVEGEVEKIGQEAGYHEDDFWNPLTAIIYRMAGSGNFIWVDNKKAPFNASTATTEPKAAGYIDEAVAVDSGVFTLVQGS